METPKAFAELEKEIERLYGKGYSVSRVTRGFVRVQCPTPKHALRMSNEINLSTVSGREVTITHSCATSTATPKPSARVTVGAIAWIISTITTLGVTLFLYIVE